MTHSIVYAAPGGYAGWPANHGAWQWGDEFLVGFLEGRYRRSPMHNIAEPFTKPLARSRDGGRTWVIEQPCVDFEGKHPTEPPPFLLGGDTIIRVCGVYDTGGDYADERGSFYLSLDRGAEWAGPYLFSGYNLPRGQIGTSRTCVLDNLVYVSRGQRDVWGTDSTHVLEHDGTRFREIGVVCADAARAVMPSVACVGDRQVATLRRRKTGVREGWVDAFGSDDRGARWKHLAFVGPTGSRNGNPPALVALPDGRLLCAFGNRDEGAMIGAVSSDRGDTWRNFVIRKGDDRYLDIGYPRLFLRSDGTPICVYYWADAERPEQHIAATEVGL